MERLADIAVVWNCQRTEVEIDPVCGTTRVTCLRMKMTGFLAGCRYTDGRARSAGNASTNTADLTSLPAVTHRQVKMQRSSSVLGEKGDDEEDEGVAEKSVVPGRLTAWDHKWQKIAARLTSCRAGESCRWLSTKLSLQGILPIRNNNMTAVSGIKQEENGGLTSNLIRMS